MGMLTFRQILADSDVAFNIAAGEALTFGESKDSAKNAFKNLTLAGGTFSNASQMTVDGTLTLNGVELINKSEEGKKTAEIDVTGAGKVLRQRHKGHKLRRPARQALQA